jgi:hypothetical protein
MGKFVVLACVLAACQPMYGPAEPLHHLPPKPKPVTPVPTEELTFVEDCNFDFHHRAPVAHTVVNAQLDTQASAQLAKADKAPTPPERVELATGAIETFTRALQADPYDPDATLGLARAYDSVQRKGCALALLKRLGTLADHPKFASAARPVAESVDAHRVWFHGYRKEAMAALGLP